MLVMDNTSFQRRKRIEQMCAEAGVKLMYLPPYSPVLEPIEEFFTELKTLIKRHWRLYEEHPEQALDVFLEWCANVVGGRTQNARYHFGHAGWTIDES